MQRFTVQSEDDGIRLNRFLQRMAPALPGGLMHKYLRTKRIKLNGKRCEAADRLHTGDVLELYIDDSFFNEPVHKPDFLHADKELDILYQDDSIAVLYKPAGLLSHSAQDAYGDSLIARFLRYLYENGEYTADSATAFTPALCNRLDRGTEGIVVAAKTADSLRTMNSIIKERRLEKLYLCAVAGTPPPDGSYDAFLAKDAARNRAEVFAQPRPGARPITTAFRTLAQRDGLALMEVDLLTGRPHQIRAHLAFLGAPVLGDVKYGDDAANKRYDMQRQALCAYKITFRPDPERDPVLAYLAGRSFHLTNVGFVRRYFPDIEISG